ncbi:MAG: hypothetical protein FGM54_04915 [Chitinophagaceae bacterium]|nr:hypothetical protein [Chitinophagaceae bacterium]
MRKPLQITAPKIPAWGVKPKAVPALNYSVLVDTGNVAQRRFNLYDSLKVVFNRVPQQLQVQSMRLYGDSVLEAEAQLKPTGDSLTYYVQHQWQENTVYLLVFLNSFAADTNGQFLAQREYRFRSKQNSDYGLLRLNVNLNPGHIWQVVRNDTLIVSQVAKDSVLIFDRLIPGQYTIRCHVDANRNGVWDNGSWPKRQLPEQVMVVADRIAVKSNWENTLNMRKGIKP